MLPLLYLGHRNYSSWSLRGWLALRWAGVRFDEQVLDLDQPGYGECRVADIVAVAPSGKVPALRVGGVVIQDSLAIAEWAAEQVPGALLPAGSLERAQVRSVVCEMHAGFAAVRRDLPMNIRRRTHAYDLPADTLRDIARLDALFSGLREQHAGAGPWLFGQRSLADAFFTPVATRFRSYGIVLSDPGAQYCAQLLSDAHFGAWEAQVLAEPAKPFSRGGVEAMYPPRA